MKQKGTIWIDAKGHEMPTYAINPVLKIEEKESQKISRLALRAEKALKELVEAAGIAASKVLEAKIKDAKMKDHKPPGEGVSMNSFDSSIEVKITKPETMYFDNIYTDMVKQKFDEYFNGLSGSSETAIFIKDIIHELMFTSGGRLDNSKVLKLRKYRDRIQGSDKMRVKGQAFVQAVDLFDKAIKTKPGNTGLYVSVTDEKTGKKRRVSLKYTDL